MNFSIGYLWGRILGIILILKGGVIIVGVRLFPRFDPYSVPADSIGIEFTTDVFGVFSRSNNCHLRCTDSFQKGIGLVSALPDAGVGWYWNPGISCSGDRVRF